MQCGCCSSCQLRRQALAAAGIADPTSYVVTARVLDSRAKNVRNQLHLHAMMQQVDWLQTCLNSTDPWSHLTERYPGFMEIVDQLSIRNQLDARWLEDQLLRLYRRYVDEWQHVQIGSGQRNNASIAFSAAA